jgi:hypothetical protein
MQASAGKPHFIIVRGLPDIEIDKKINTSIIRSFYVNRESKLCLSNLQW